MKNRRKLQQMKFKATKQLFTGIAIALVATIPVALNIGTDCTGSVFCWILAGIAIFDGIKRLVKYNKIG